MNKIRIALVGVGNCASALLQGIAYYAEKHPDEALGLMHWEIGGYRASDIEVVAAFDIDRRKVGLDVSRAIFAKPNCTKVFCGSVPDSGVIVSMGCVLDGVSDEMRQYDESISFSLSQESEPERDEVINMLKQSKADLLLNYLPVGSEQATRFYAECALEAGVGVINCIPVFIASDPEWVQQFEKRGLPLIGDDVKSQLGATITHRMLAELFRRRGVVLDRTYQLNTGGNTDFLNMVDRTRLTSKKISKTEAVQSAVGKPLNDQDIHIGPSDYVAWQGDNKVCFIRMEGRLFGDVPMNLELRLSVEDSPNSAGVIIDAIRCGKLALERGQGGALSGPCAYFMKHPPRQYDDEEAARLVEAFIRGEAE